MQIQRITYLSAVTYTEKKVKKQNSKLCKHSIIFHHQGNILSPRHPIILEAVKGYHVNKRNKTSIYVPKPKLITFNSSGTFFFFDFLKIK